MSDHLTPENGKYADLIINFGEADTLPASDMTLDEFSAFLALLAKEENDGRKE